MGSDPDAPPGFRRLFEPLTIGGLTLRNRIVNTTHGTGLGEERELAYLAARAHGGAGLLGIHSVAGIYGYAVGPGPQRRTGEWDVDAPSPVTEAGIAHYDDLVIPALRRRAEVIHAGGAAVFAQVYHSGAARHGTTAAPVIAPSSVPDPYEAKVPHALTSPEVEDLVVAFAQGVRRIRDAGLDGAEIHGAHGYLVHQFLSPYFNRRDDRWGGDRERRLQFVRETLSAARGMVGADFPIGIRIGTDAGDVGRGIDLAELVEIARLLAPDVAWISVSGGNYAGFGDGVETAYVGPWLTEPGANVTASAAVRSAVGVPVLVTGRIADAADAERILADGSADLVGMVRALIADPELPVKIRSGRALEVRPCLGLSECHHIGPHRTPLTCAVNAAAAREAELTIDPAEVPRTVAIVGAGPAGLETARVAALRGHTVYLADAARSIGGTPAILALDPARRNLRDHAAWFETQLRELGVSLLLGQRVEADDLLGFDADVIVVATGGVPFVPVVPGIGDPNVTTALDVLGGATVRDRVVVVSGLDDHLAGPTVAAFLADTGVAVELIGEQVDFARGAEDGTRLPLLARLLRAGVTVSPMSALAAVERGGARIRHTVTGAERLVAGATVVLACGLRPDDRLARELAEAGREVHLVGDALAPRRIMHATLDGARVGVRV